MEAGCCCGCTCVDTYGLPTHVLTSTILNFGKYEDSDNLIVIYLFSIICSEHNPSKNAELRKPTGRILEAVNLMRAFHYQVDSIPRYNSAKTVIRYTGLSPRRPVWEAVIEVYIC